MPTIVVGFAGAIGVGKTTVSVAVAEMLGWKRASFGDYVRTEAQRRGLDPTRREILQSIGEDLIHQGWGQFCEAVLTSVQWVQGQSLIIDGVRHVGAVSTLQTLVAPTPFKLIYLSALEDVRHEHLLTRGVAYGKEHERIEAHTTEREVRNDLPKIADYSLQVGHQSSDELAKQVVEWLAGILSNTLSR